MRILPGILVLAAVVTPALSQAQSGSVPTKADVQKLADEHAARRDAGQWDGYAEDLTPDATVMSSAGKWQRGRAEVLSVGIDLSTVPDRSGARARFYQEAVRSVAALPGVERVALAALVPMDGSNSQVALRIADGRPPIPISPDINIVGAG